MITVNNKRTDMDKPFSDWTFDELCNQLTWDFVQGFASGVTLKSLVWKACNSAIMWREAQQKKEKEEP